MDDINKGYFVYVVGKQLPTHAFPKIDIDYDFDG